MRDDDHYDDERPSWRELDKRKDRSSHVESRDSIPRSRKSSYKSNLDRLFQKGAKKTVRKDEKLAVKVIESQGTPEFSKLCNQYVKANGMPEDWELLMLLLEHKDPGMVEKAIEAIVPMIDTFGPERRGLLKSQLNIIEMTSKSTEVQDLAREAMEKL